MRPDFTEIGVACARAPSSEYGTYWTLKLAAPLDRTLSGSKREAGKTHSNAKTQRSQKYLCVLASLRFEHSGP